MKRTTMKFNIMMLMLLIGMIGMVSAVACPDDNNIQSDNIPCEVLTPAQMSCSTNATIIYLNNVSVNKSVIMNLKYADIELYNFSFDYTPLGYYFILLCDNSTAIYRVYDKDIIETAAPVNFIGGGIGGYTLPSFGDGKLTISEAEGYLSNFWSVLWGLALKYYYITIALLFSIFMALGYRIRYRKHQLKVLKSNKSVTTI